MKRIRNFFHLIHNNDGVVLIEAAIIVPILLLLVLGTIEFGFYFFSQHIASRAIDSVAIPLQLNPNDQKREIEALVRSSGSGFVDFSINNKKGNYICARAYENLADARNNLCYSKQGENGWHPEPAYSFINPAQTYYIAVVAHIDYKSFFGLGRILPAINQSHVVMIPAITIAAPAAQIPQIPIQPQTPPSSGSNYGDFRGSSGNEDDVARAINDLNRLISNMPNQR